MIGSFKAGFRSRPVLGRLRLGLWELSTRSRLRLQVKENMLEFFKTDYELSKIYTCTGTYRSSFIFTLENTSNEVKFHVICVNY